MLQHCLQFGTRDGPSGKLLDVPGGCPEPPGRLLPAVWDAFRQICGANERVSK